MVGLVPTIHVFPSAALQGVDARRKAKHGGRESPGTPRMISSLFHLARTARVGFVLAREGALALIDPSALPPLARGAIRLGRLIERKGAGSSATRLAVALTRLGPSYVKFGQFLATRPDVVGMRIASDLSALQIGRAHV